MDGVKQYFKHFKVLFIIAGITLAVFLAAYIANKDKEVPVVYSGNTERVYGSQRVFDFANQLSDEEEYKLEKHIHEAEIRAASDIVIVTLNESLKDYEVEYRSRYSIPVTPDKYVMVYADKFWEDNKFGYDCPQVLDGSKSTGDGVILVDNLHREEETGKIHTWMGTTGECETKYSSSMIDEALDRFYDYVETDYYKACIAFVDSVAGTMGPHSFVVSDTAKKVIWIVAAVIMLGYFFANSKSRAGKVTTTATTYVVNGTSRFVRKEDNFIRKTVTKRYNPPQSSSGGGGGSHTSGGGGSHGGGGHSR